jgi:magnesium-transporting ATPase (P-type)
MRLFFSILSLAYISGIFLLADSPIVSSLAPFNPYSLLHIPLYGILTILLILSIIPFKIKHNNPINQRDQKDQRDQIDQIDQINQINRFLIAGLITLGVAIADEIYQSFIPSRDASIKDVFLDLIGITFVLFLFHQLYKGKKARIAIQPDD